MEIKDLVGLHKLSGVDMGHENIKRDWGDDFENCTVCNFILDKVVYSAIEDPSDGYRSSMRELKISKGKISNKFPPLQVLGIMRVNHDYSYHSQDVIDFYDCKNGKRVLSIGTSNYDDYYPSFVADFTPENMSINE